LATGHNNIITLTSSKVDAETGLRGLDKEKRNCLFQDKISGLQIHKKYSYLNCKFECNLFYSQQAVLKKHNVLCLPWFFPTPNDSTIFCDPWQSYDFFQIMSNEIPDNLCLHCLPECNATVYKPKITVVPFTRCQFHQHFASIFMLKDPNSVIILLSRSKQSKRQENKKKNRRNRNMKLRDGVSFTQWRGGFPRELCFPSSCISKIQEAYFCVQINRIDRN